jgi:hypothetical protein
MPIARRDSDMMGVNRRQLLHHRRFDVGGQPRRTPDLGAQVVGALIDARPQVELDRHDETPRARSR